MFDQLKTIRRKPHPFEFSTTELFWNDGSISKQMLDFQLNY